ncbi:holo-ACP synthase [Sediminivirga luteola]|uniref:Holo-[acyl-carrier-protein] synthase n=1 Tax=Sediminivirga luteola TaxID=1774748 RepID=A0A8J2TWW2_9MICO|nr:holo-ACP synthase [Sediminivirga luteola]GGA10061.1 holo-[acyl-carrier-protein] synthase [Sediminivirga luteola]
MNIIGVGVDVADVRRFRERIERTPELLDRLLTPAERTTPSGTPRTVESLAARFAAKEAAAKALVYPRTLPWREVEVVTGEHGEPALRLSGAVAERLRELGGRRMHLSLSHDAALAIAYVIAEG